MFQAVYGWATYPTDFIDASFASLANWTKNTLPPGAFTNLLAEGIIAGIGGVMVFILPIAILFLFISLLEESGYMSRVVFLLDSIMKRFGLSGKSVVPLISGNACAIPAVIAARNIESWKKRLITFRDAFYNLFCEITCIRNYYCFSDSRRKLFRLELSSLNVNVIIYHWVYDCNYFGLYSQ